MKSQSEKTGGKLNREYDLLNLEAYGKEFDNMFIDMGYPFYFQFMLTPYDRSIERGLPDKIDLNENL